MSRDAFVPKANQTGIRILVLALAVALAPASALVLGACGDDTPPEDVPDCPQDVPADFCEAVGSGTCYYANPAVGDFTLGSASHCVGLGAYESGEGPVTKLWTVFTCD